MVIKYGTFTKENDRGEAGESVEKECRFLKTYTVFSACQIEGVAFQALQPTPTFTPSEQCARAREIVAGMPQRPEIKEGKAIPYYQPDTDTVHMPELGYFANDEAYCSTLFHELAHATGHQSRLGRKSLLENKGIEAEGEAKKVYAEEELIAEMSAAFLNAHAGIMETEVENSAAYLQGWIVAFKGQDAKGWIVKAAREAQEAARFILDNKEL